MASAERSFHAILLFFFQVMGTVQYYFKFLCIEKSSGPQEAQLSSGKEVKLDWGN